MIPHNIQQKLEERRKEHGLNWRDKANERILKGQEISPDQIRYAVETGYDACASDLWQILTEGAGEFDETSAHEAGVRLTQRFAGYVEKPGHELETLQINSTIDGARWQFNILKPKMMAMELEMKHMRDQYVKDAKMMESQKLEIERLNVKSMAMEAEIQRLRDELEAIKYDHAETVELMMNGSERG